MENLVYFQIDTNTVQAQAIIAMLRTMEFAKQLQAESIDNITAKGKNHSKNEVDGWYLLSDEEREDIEAGLKDLENGDYMDARELIKKYR